MTTRQNVLHDLIQQISQGTYAKGTLLPGENKLADRYGTSRNTIRKVLSDLVQRGLIQKINGKGSMVIEQQQFVFPLSNIVSYKEIVAEQHLDNETQLVSLTEKKLPVAVFNELDADLQSVDVHAMVSVHLVNAKPVIIDHEYVFTSVVPTLSQHVAEDSVYEYFEDELGLKIAYARKEISAEYASAENQQLLGLTPQQMVVVVKSVTYLEDTTPFECTESRHRADMFKFRDFARRL